LTSVFKGKSRYLNALVASLSSATVTSVSYAAPVNDSLKNNETIVYQYKICPFCNKVKSLFDYLQVNYSTVEVSPLTKSQLSWSEYKKVPVVKVNDKVFNDSAAL
jgi:microsomal prostaglandin-E synthase 2